jgi:hypothetical protein
MAPPAEERAMDINVPEFVILVAVLSVVVFIGIHFFGRRRKN